MPAGDEDEITIHGGSAADPVIPIGIFSDAVIRKCPDFPARAGLETIHGVFVRRVAQDIQPALADGDRAIASAHLRLPDLVETLLRPGN